MTAACGEDHGAAEKQFEEEGVAERNCYGLTTIPITHPTAVVLDRAECKGTGNERVKLSPRRCGVWWG